MTNSDDNLRHWSALSHTDPRHTKPFQRAGGFRGTAIKPIWNIMRLTEHFGPIGIGWGTYEPNYRIVEASQETMVFCILKCWYVEHGPDKDASGNFIETTAEIWGIGGDRLLMKRQDGIMGDDEAFKKPYTDALTNAFVRLGMSADIHLGLFEDSKYLAEVREHFSPTIKLPVE